jgi:tRNA threonylcarbamoyladenosine biosynthesis protein TsaB
MTDKLTIAIETSGRVGSAAIGRGNEFISEVFFSGFMKHSAELFSTLEKLLTKADASINDIQDVYITAGPGSFTGLRIAVTVAKMFYFTQNSQIVAADTMDVIAENADQCIPDSGETINHISVILDAKKNLFYTAIYDRFNGSWKKSLETQIMTAEGLLQWLEANAKHNVALLGEGLVYYADKFKSPFTHLMNERYWSARASGLFHVGHRMSELDMYTDPMKLTPTYIGLPDAVSKQQPTARPGK